MRVWITTVVFFAAIAMGCSASYETFDGYDESINFKEIESYEWKPINGIKWLDHKAFKRAVDENLNTKGYHLSPLDADFVIETAYNKVALRRSTVGSRVRPQKGELVLIFVTPDTGKIIWHGKARVEYDSRFPMQIQNTDIDTAVSTILKSFPPPPSVTGP